MIENTVIQNTFKRNYHSLKKEDNFYRAELKLELVPFYTFKLRELSGKEACFLIKQDSIIFNELKVGKLLEMKYWTNGKIENIKLVKAKVKNITIQNQKLNNGYYLVYLSIPTVRD